MRKKRAQPEALPTIWQVPDELWSMVAPILAELDLPKSTRRKRIDARAALEAIIFQHISSESSSRPQSSRPVGSGERLPARASVPARESPQAVASCPGHPAPPNALLTSHR